MSGSRTTPPKLFRERGYRGHEYACAKFNGRNRTFGRSEPAAEFGPLKLREIRDGMVNSGLARSTVKSRVNRIRRAFRWAASFERLPSSVVEGLRTVGGLRRGRTAACEPLPVRPVCLDHVKQTAARLSRQAAAMVWLQWWSGMRPGEVIQLRPPDVDRSGEVWIYRPSHHKTEHHGREREIDLGPRAQEILSSAAPVTISSIPKTWALPPSRGTQ